MDEYGVPPCRVAALHGKGWYSGYHTIRASRDTHEFIISYFGVICNNFVCGDGESSLHIQRGVECGRILCTSFLISHRGIKCGGVVCRRG